MKPKQARKKNFTAGEIGEIIVKLLNSQRNVTAKIFFLFFAKLTYAMI